MKINEFRRDLVRPSHPSYRFRQGFASKTLVFVWFCALHGKNIVGFWPQEDESVIGVHDFTPGMSGKKVQQQKGPLLGIVVLSQQNGHF